MAATVQFISPSLAFRRIQRVPRPNCGPIVLAEGMSKSGGGLAADQPALFFQFPNLEMRQEFRIVELALRAFN
jgi:hypothetical protein